MATLETVGTAIGSIWGPMGASIGGSLGSMFGSSGSGLTRAQLRRQSEQAYSITGQTIEYLGEGRIEAESTYQSKLASARARYGASGARLEGTGWDQVRGEILRERDEVLTNYSQEEDVFRQGEAYSIFKKDYEQMTLVGVSGERGDTEYSIRAEGASGESIFTEAQRETLHTFRGIRWSGKDVSTEYKQYTEYASRLAPGIEAYEIARFGTDEDRATFEADMSTRISDANTWYERQVQEEQIRKANFYNFKGDR